MPEVHKIDPRKYPSCEKKTRHLTGIVLMFHPQCGHCVQMRPQWEMMKKRVPSNVKIIEIDGSEMSGSPTLSRSPVGQETEGFPTIMRLNNGKVVEKFSGERTEENLVNFVKKSGKGENKRRATNRMRRTRRVRRTNKNKK